MTRVMQKSDTTAPEYLPIQQTFLYSCAMAIQYEKRYLVLARATGSRIIGGFIRVDVCVLSFFPP